MSKSRRGFTLVELLTVIVVVSILSTLLVVGGMSALSSSREASAKSTLEKCGRIIKDRQTAFWESTKEHAHGNYGAVFGRFNSQVGGASTPEQVRIQTVRDGIKSRIEAVCGPPTASGWNERLASLILHIELERIFFPQTWDEAEYMRAVAGEPAIASNPANPVENSEVLHWMLTTKSVVGNLPEDYDSILPNMVGDTDGNGLKEIVDSWGNPVRFYRWPTRIMDTPSIVSLMYGIVPTDPAKDSRNTLNLGSMDEPEYYRPQTYHSPILVSAGPDGKHGLLNPVDKASFGYWGKVVPEDVIPEPMPPVILENPGHRDAFDDITAK